VGPAGVVSDLYPTQAAGKVWVCDVYRASQANVRCIMGYIVNLTVILDALFSTTCDGSLNNFQLVLESHVSSGNKDKIHRDIHRFVSEMELSGMQRDLILEKIIDLIQLFCVPPSRQ